MLTFYYPGSVAVLVHSYFNATWPSCPQLDNSHISKLSIPRYRVALLLNSCNAACCGLASGFAVLVLMVNSLCFALLVLMFSDLRY